MRCEYHAALSECREWRCLLARSTSRPGPCCATAAQSLRGHVTDQNNSRARHTRLSAGYQPPCPRFRSLSLPPSVCQTTQNTIIMLVVEQGRRTRVRAVARRRQLENRGERCFPLQLPEPRGGLAALRTPSTSKCACHAMIVYNIYTAQSYYMDAGREK